MKVLLVTAPLLGHLFPLVPLTTALRDQGHDVRFATAGDAAAAPTDGVPVRNIAAGFDFGPIARQVMLRYPLIAKAELAGRGGTRGVSRLFATVNEKFLPGLTHAVKDAKPDLVVYEPLAPVAALIAARFGIPAVLHENSLYDGPTLVDAVCEQLFASGVVDDPGDARDPIGTLTIAPPSVVGRRTGIPMRPVPYGGEGAIPDWLHETPGRRPRIVVSRSTVPGPGRDLLMSTIVRAATGLDVEVLLIRPDRRTARRDLPSNVRTSDWLPLPDVLGASTAIVHHGGSGSVLAAFAAGVPQLVVPGAGDRRHNAELVQRRGAGLAFGTRQITAATLDSLVRDGRLADAAQEVPREILAMPAPATAAQQVQRLAEQGPHPTRR